MKNKKWLGKFYDDFKFKVTGRRAIMRDMQALDELKDITSVASSISDYAKEHGKTIDEMLDVEIEASLRESKSTLFLNGLDAYYAMPDSTKLIMLKYSRAHLEHKPRKEDIKSLAISGGGGKGQFYVGTLKAMERDGLLKQIETFAGASAGALTAIPLALGCDTRELMRIVESTDFRGFLIEGRDYNSEHKRSKQQTKDTHVQMGLDDYGKDEQVTNLVNSIKVHAERNSPLNIVNAKHCFDKNGQLVRFFNFSLDKPLKTEFKEDNFEDLVEELWLNKRVQKFCTSIMNTQNKKAGFEFHEFPKDILVLGLAFTFEYDYIEHYFGQLIKSKIEEYVDLDNGFEDLIRINPEMENESNWQNLTLSELGQLSRTETGKKFGFKDLVIGVTRTKIRGDETAVGKFFKQFINTEGVIVSSDPDRGDDDYLTDAPIKELARMSMAIPGFFANKEYDGKTYVDGGLHNNLPTKYFDKNGFDNSVLSLIPFTGSEIEKANTVQEAFVRLPSSPKTESYLDVPGQIKSIFDKMVMGVANLIVMCGNKAYREMGLRESFRNVIINSQQYGTLSFKPEGNDLYRLNKLSRHSYYGFNRIMDDSPGLFDSDYNSAIRFFEHKQIQHKSSSPEYYKLAKEKYMQEKSSSATNEFSSGIAIDSLQHLIAKSMAADKKRERESLAAAGLG